MQYSQEIAVKSRENTDQAPFGQFDEEIVEKESNFLKFRKKEIISLARKEVYLNRIVY